MSEYERKYEAAQQELKQTQLPPQAATNWFYRGLLRFGVKVRPPLYTGLFRLGLSTGIYFGVTFGLLMWLVQWRANGLPVLIAIGTAVFAGVFFGLFVARMSMRARRKWKLSRWEDL